MLRILNETGRWRTRDMKYWGGTWPHVRDQIPTFETAPFQAVAGQANPYLKSVVRLPLTAAEAPMPVGVVSNTYTLAQHRDVAAKCLEGIEESGISVKDLDCEIGLTELGEWMDFRIYFPKEYDFETGPGDRLRLRLEVFNSVDGSSRLVLFLGWLRLVCSNGMVIGKTKVSFDDVHNRFMDIRTIPEIVASGLDLVDDDRERIHWWRCSEIAENGLAKWADQEVTKAWGKKAACRAYHICLAGRDVVFPLPFAPGSATQKPVQYSVEVPGAPLPSKTLYDVSQALSWVAARKNNPEDRRDLQAQIPGLLKSVPLRSQAIGLSSLFD